MSLNRISDEMATVNSGVSEKVTLALFGVGRIGSVHLKSIARHLRIHLKYLVEEAVDIAKKALNDVGLEHVSIVNFKGVSQVLEDKSVQGVVVCTPTSTHQKVVTQALRAGKAVFCEKPVAHNSEAADECYKVAEECKLPLLCAFHKRFDPTFGPIIKRSRDGEIGQIRYIKTTLRDTMDPSFPGLSTLGGCFLDLALHDVDLACACIGEFPTTVSGDGHAFAKDIEKNKDFDQAIANLKFPSGALATIEMSRFCNYGYDQRLEVFGIEGMLSGSNVHDNHVVAFNSSGTSQPKLQASFPERYLESYYNEMDHFVKVIQGKEKLCISRIDAVAAIKIVEACEKAAKTKTIIDLTW
ncbi:inositol 2-dehydrogenase-like isoform X2 [Amphiura filiformis]|uniref:inositol 2-dehydrogenase-like isoform X2 n=1 Tax=Amphiura filiformis TaxID=82378 RepID=UPI003B21970A